MPKLYFLDPEREPRDCDLCRGTGGANCVVNRDDLGRCRDCRGTGRLGVEGARPDVQVLALGKGYVAIPLNQQVGPNLIELRTYCATTETAALEAARRAHKPAELTPHKRAIELIKAGSYPSYHKAYEAAKRGE